MDRIFISIGPINIYWYSVLIVVSIIIGMYFSLKEANKNFGKKIAKVADIVVIVNKVNFADIKQGLDEEKFNSENIYQAETLEKAKLLMKDFIKKGDAILFENDLPDTYI